MFPVNDSSPKPFVDTSASALLTYEPFYGLREKPFSLNADPRFLFRSPSHAPAFDALLAGIRRREGLIVLTGEIGTGKTTLCRSVLQHLDRRTFSAFVPDPFLSREDLLKTLLVDFGVISVADLTRGRFNGASRSDLSYPLYEFLDSLVPLQAFAVLVIDEAQNLALPLLEEIRILSELERREKLLQVVMVGQPELRSSLKLPQMRQVEQRVSVRCELKALDVEGTAGYVKHRLSVAGGSEHRAEFTQDALAAVHFGSSGVPRLINRLCDRALEGAYAQQSLRVDVHFVWEAINDLGLSPAPHVDERQADEATPSFVGAGQPIADTPGQFSAQSPMSLALISTQPEDEQPSLGDFLPEADLPNGQRAQAARSTSRAPWVAGLVTSVLAFSASLGGVSWYLRAQTVQASIEAPLLPPRPPGAASQPANESQPANAPQPANEMPVTDPARYSILVASFANRARAERLVEELTRAGYRARVVERDWGPPRGRLVHVNVGGYASAIDVQRDLQHIRNLPGGYYSDARIVGQ
jgi:general secretion pathway protein A